MTAALPSGRNGRVLALGLMFLSIGLVYVAVATPLLELYSQRVASLETRQAMRLKLEQIVERLPALRARAAELRSAPNTERLTLEGASDPIAAAALQSRLEELASANGVTIGSTESLAVQAEGGFRRIGLRLVVSAPYGGLVKLLAAVEAARPPLVVNSFQIHSFQRRPGAVTLDVLDASLEIYGLRAAEAGAPARQ